MSDLRGLKAFFDQKRSTPILFGFCNNFSMRKENFIRSLFFRMAMNHNGDSRHRAYILKILENIVFRSTNPPGGRGVPSDLKILRTFFENLKILSKKGEILRF